MRLEVDQLPRERGKAVDALGALVRVDALAEPMQRGETASYVFERLVRGSVGTELTARCKDALDAVHAASAGVPREVSAAFSLLLAGRATRHSST